MEAEKTYYLVTFRDNEKLTKSDTLTLKVKTIHDSTLGLGFISLSNFVFEDTGPIVDPKFETLKKRFENTKSLHLSLYSIISVEEVGEDHPGLKFTKDKSNLLSFVPNPEQPN